MPDAPPPVTLYEDATVRISKRGYDEFCVDTKVVDCPAVRVGSAEGTIGQVAFDRLLPNGTRYVVATIIGSTEPGPLKGTLGVHINDGSGSTDAAMKKVMEMTSEGVRVKFLGFL